MRTTPIITFGPNALSISNDSEISSDDVQLFANMEDLSTKATSRYAFASYEPDYWLLDGTYGFLSDNSHVGYVSESMSDGDGKFDTPPVITIDFDEEHSTNGLTLHFAHISNDWASELTISFYDAGDSLIRSDQYNPTSETFQTNQAVSDFKKIEIEFTETNKPYRFARLAGIDFDEIIEFRGDSILEARLIEQIDRISVTLPISRITFKLFSAEGDFSIIEPAGIYADMQAGQPVDVHESMGDEVIFIGRFYIEKWESLSANVIAIDAVDAIGLLEQVTHMGFIHGGAAGLGLSGDLIADIFESAGIKYDLASEFQAYGIDGWLPITNARDALCQVLFPMSGSVAISARSPIVRIVRISLTTHINNNDFDFHLSASDLGRDTSLTLKPLVTDVEAVGRRIAGSSDTITVHNGVLDAGTQRILFNEPMYDLNISGATIITSHPNYVDVSVASTGTVEITGKRYVLIDIFATSHNEDAPENAPPNIVKINPRLLSGSNPLTVINRASFVKQYYQQRFMLKTTLYAHRATVGQYCTADVQGGRQMAGVVEKMETDLAGGFVSKAEIVGVILPEE